MEFSYDRWFGIIGYRDANNIRIYLDEDWNHSFVGETTRTGDIMNAWWTLFDLMNRRVGK